MCENLMMKDEMKDASNEGPSHDVVRFGPLNIQLATLASSRSVI